MSHELEQYANGSTAFVAGHNQDAWHQLGTVLPKGLTAQDVMTFAHLGGWDVRKRGIETVLLSQDGAGLGRGRVGTGVLARCRCGTQGLGPAA